jgi:allantoin racemase
VIVLGCAGMTEFCAGIAAELGVPVIDGVSAAVAAVEGLVRLGLGTSRVGEYAVPPQKAYTGALAGFGIVDHPAPCR